MSVAPIDDYPEKRLLDTLLSCAPEHVDEPDCGVVLTPGEFTILRTSNTRFLH